MLALVVAAAVASGALHNPCGSSASLCNCACVVGQHGIPEFSRRFLESSPICGDHATQAVHHSVVTQCGGDASVAETILACTGDRTFPPQCYTHGSAAVELVLLGTATAVALWLPVVHAASSL